MIKVILEDNASFEANSYEDIVSAMKLDVWVRPSSKEDYMSEVAKRCEVWDGSKIEYSNAEEFIHELRRVGVVKMLVVSK